MSEKQINYTDEMVARLHEVYDGKASDKDRRAQIKTLADELGRSEASVRAKLTNEGIYVKYDKPTPKKGGVKKADLVTAIAKVLNEDEAVLDSLEKATMVALKRVLKGLIQKS